MPVSPLLYPFIQSDVPSTAGLMDSFLPLHHPSSDTRDHPFTHTPKTSVRTTDAGRKGLSLPKYRRKGKEQVLGKRRGSAAEQATQKRFMQWAGRTIYSLHAAMSLATEPAHKAPPAVEEVCEEPRLADCRDFLPVMEAAEEPFQLSETHREDLETAYMPITGGSTPELGWSSPSSSTGSWTLPPTPNRSLPQGRRDGGRALKEGCSEQIGGGLGLWFGESELEDVADDMFSRFINVEE